MTNFKFRTRRGSRKSPDPKWESICAVSSYLLIIFYPTGLLCNQADMLVRDSSLVIHYVLVLSFLFPPGPNGKSLSFSAL